MTYDYPTWCAKYHRLKDIADRVAASRRERARVLCAAAGLDPELLGIHPHNAMCGFERGQPWAGVDYDLVRRCLHLLRTQFEGCRIVENWDKRVRGYA